MISFGEAWWLLAAVPVVALAVWVSRRGRVPVPAIQRRIALGARTTALLLVVSALAQPALSLADDQRTVLFLVDRSASMSAGALDAQAAYLDDALAEAGPTDLSAIAVFGGDVRVDAALAEGRVGADVIRAVVDDSATDLAGALRAAEALLPSSGSRRIVVLTDSVATTGDPRPVAQGLGEAGIAVDIVPLEAGRGPDVLVEAIRMPPVARLGDSVTATVVTRSNQAGSALLDVVIGEEVRSIPVEVEAGVNEFEVATEVDATGFLQVTAEVRAEFDTVAGNNRAQGLTRVIGPARVAVVEGVPGEADQLIQALTAAGLDAVETSTVPDAAGLLAIDALVLVNVAAPDSDTADRIRAFVEDLGRGLVVVGGDQAYGLGGYEQSALEDLLPVRSNPDDLLRRQPVAEVLVIDTSGSMGRCHCRDGAFDEGGVNKTDISRAGAALAIDALTAQDRVGVVAFGSGTEWVIPFAQTPNAADAEAALATLTPDGDTAIARGLQAALEELSGADESLRHIVLFTDGWDPNEGTLIPLTREIADAGITLSVLGTGEGPGVTLQRMAEIGGGRYYNGANLDEIPEIFVEETLTVARSLAQEGTFFPIKGTPVPATENLETAPPLGGFVLTKIKPTATQGLLIAEQDPLLATWQRGLGRVTAWTADATARWAADWIVWDRYVDFWGSVVGDVVPPGRESPPVVDVRGGSLGVSYTVEDVPLTATASATVRSPNGEVSVVPLARTAENEFSGQVDAGVLGAYWVAVSVFDDGAMIASGSSGAVSSYSDEFAFREPDPTLAADLAELSGGRVDPDAASVFDPAAVLGRAITPIWRWLAMAALALFLIDVTLRRLVIFQDAGAEYAADPGGPRRRRAEFVEDDAAAEPAGPSTETLGRLLDRRRR